jgi:hypothetical protein
MRKQIIFFSSVIVGLGLAISIARHFGIPLSRAQRGKIEGTLGIDDANLEARIYNGTGWRVRDVTVRVTFQPITEPKCLPPSDNPLLKGYLPYGDALYLTPKPNCEEMKKAFKDLPNRVKKMETRSYVLRLDCGAGQTIRVNIPSAMLLYDRKVEWEVEGASGFPF